MRGYAQGVAREHGHVNTGEELSKKRPKNKNAGHEARRFCVFKKTLVDELAHRAQVVEHGFQLVAVLFDGAGDGGFHLFRTRKL